MASSSRKLEGLKLARLQDKGISDLEKEVQCLMSEVSAYHRFESRWKESTKEEIQAALKIKDQELQEARQQNLCLSQELLQASEKRKKQHSLDRFDTESKESTGDSTICQSCTQLETEWQIAQDEIANLRNQLRKVETRLAVTTEYQSDRHRKDTARFDTTTKLEDRVLKLEQEVSNYKEEKLEQEKRTSSLEQRVEDLVNRLQDAKSDQKIKDEQLRHLRGVLEDSRNQECKRQQHEQSDEDFDEILSGELELMRNCYENKLQELRDQIELLKTQI